MIRSRGGALEAFCLVLVLQCASCYSENVWDGLSDSHSTANSSGKLSPACIEKYHQTYVQRTVPKRSYRYFDEDKEHRESLKKSEGAVDLQWRIVGGQQVDISQAPYAVLYGLYCGGSLIAPDWVITAAHCKTLDDFIIAGSTKASEGTRYQICAHFVHPRWKDPKKVHFHDFDYQLLLLETPVPVTARSRPIAIGRPRDVVFGSKVTITGWGHTQMKVLLLMETPVPVTARSRPIAIGHPRDVLYGSKVTITGWVHTQMKQKSMQNILRQVSVPIIAQEDCKELPHRYYASITSRMFCAGLFNGTKDSCQGDSGGPAVANHKLVGLVSFGVGCAEREKPGVYSNVPLARSWIREVTGLPL